MYMLAKLGHLRKCPGDVEMNHESDDTVLEAHESKDVTWWSELVNRPSTPRSLSLPTTLNVQIYSI